MTLNSVNEPAQRRGALARGRAFLKGLAVVLAAAAFLAWIALGLVLFGGGERNLKMAAAIAAAVSTEALFWTVAALLGVTVVEARKRLWGFLTRAGR